ncbi:MAG: hypothetical protein Roseis2KO_58110 [Roseivirga sp.]
MEDYFMISGVSLLLLYLAYRFLFRQRLDYQSNRFLALSCVIFSAVLPFLSFESVPVVQETLGEGLAEVIAIDLPRFQATPDSGSSFNAWWLIYCLGAGFFLIRFVISVVRLLMLYRNATKSHNRGFLVAKVNQKLSPFTFFHVLFIGAEEVENEELDVMIAHEQCHRDQWHSVDSLLLEFATILFWFNPAVWLFQKAIRSEHEFMADRQVLSQGFDLKAYQHLLFQSATGVALSLGNNLINKVSLIKRFEMMSQVTKKSNSVYYRTGLYACLMATFVLFTAFTNGGPVMSADSPAVYKEGETEMYRFIRTKVKYPASAREQGNTGSVVVSFRVKKDGSVDQVKAKKRKGETLNEMVVVGYADPTGAGFSSVLENEVVRVISQLGTFVPAQKDGKPVNSILNIPFEFKLK